MDDDLETLLVEVRASTDGFKSDIEAMRSSFDNTLVGGFAQAGNVLERGLTSAIRRGSLGFDDLKHIALQTMNEIAANALQSGFANILEGQRAGGGANSLLSTAVGALLGLPGRATGGPVSPGRAYLVGERGPEVFVPTSSGRVEAGPDRQRQDKAVRVSINIATPRGTDAPVAMRRTSRQVASAVSRALRAY